MDVSLQMVEEKRKLYESLQKEYEDIHYREELFRVAIGLVKHSVSVVDIQKRSLRRTYYEKEWTHGVDEMYNVPESIIAEGIVHEDSVEVYCNMFKDIYSGVPEGGCVIRAQEKGGKWCWLQASYKTLFAENGQPHKAICYSENISQKHEAEQMFQQFMKIVDGKSDYSYQVNLTQDRVTRYNEDNLHRVGISESMSYSRVHQIALENVVEKYKPLISEKFGRLALLQKFYDGEREVTVQYEYIWPGSTQSVWIESRMYLLMNTDGDVCAILSARNIQAEKNSEQEKLRKAQYDQLCPVLKRDVFEQRMLAKMDEKKDMVLLMLDVDKFKAVNDGFGHAFGDEVLIGVAETINNSFRQTDLITRFGGDEFCILMLGNFDIHVLDNSAKLLLEKVKSVEFTQDYHASISLGAVRWNKNDTLKELFEKADKMLYEAKKQRGCYRIWMDDKQEDIEPSK